MYYKNILKTKKNTFYGKGVLYSEAEFKLSSEFITGDNRFQFCF